MSDQKTTRATEPANADETESQFLSFEEAQALAEEHYRAGRFIVCRNILLQILESQPQFAQALKLLGGAYFSLGNYAAAAAQWELFVERRPEDADGELNLTEAYRKAKEYGKAEEHGRRAVALNPESATVHNTLGVVLRKCGKLDETVEILAKAIALDADFAPAHHNMAIVLQSQGKLDAACESYGRAAACEPDNFKLAVVLSAAQHAIGEIELERDTLKAAILRNPIHTRQAEASPIAHILEMRGAQNTIFGTQFRGDDLHVTMDGGNFKLGGLIKSLRFTKHNFYIFGDNLLTYGDLPEHDIIVNVIADPDLELESLQTLSRYLGDRPAVPLINHPDHVEKTTRDQNYRRLKDIDGILFPKTVRLSIENVSPKTVTKRIMDDGFSFPLLLRETGTHTGATFVTVSSKKTISDYVKGAKSKSIYAIQFHDYTFHEKYFRKMRIFCIDGVLYPVVCHIDDHWNVHGSNRTKLMLDHGWMMDEERYFVSDCRGYVGKRTFDLLGRLHDVMNLDFFGVDFTILEDGTVMIFEINCSMQHHFNHAKEFPYLKRSLEAVSQAFEAMVIRRSGAGRAAQ